MVGIVGDCGDNGQGYPGLTTADGDGDGGKGGGDADSGGQCGH